MLRVDISDVEEAVATSSAHLRQIPGAMAKAGRDAAAYSRSNHDYQNRTGQTEANTRSVTEIHGDAVYTLVEIGVPHASYLMKGGTTRRHESLTSLEDGIERTERELDFFYDGLGDTFGSL